MTLTNPNILTKAVAMDKQSLLEEIDRLGWYVRGGEVYKKEHFNHWCGTFLLDHIDGVRSEVRGVLKETPGISIEQALVEVFRRRDREWEEPGGLPRCLEG